MTHTLRPSQMQLSDQEYYTRLKDRQLEPLKILTTLDQRFNAAQFVTADPESLGSVGHHFKNAGSVASCCPPHLFTGQSSCEVEIAPQEEYQRIMDSTWGHPDDSEVEQEKQSKVATLLVQGRSGGGPGSAFV